MAEQILDALHSEFADVAEVGDVVRILVRLLLAAFLGGLIGWERERRHKPAGLRTQMLVAIGSALFVLVPSEGGMAMADLGRVIQGIVVGVGFLGAGAIIKHRDEDLVRGLTTAAGVWLTAAIGCACGLGRDTTAVIATALALAVLVLVPAHLDREPH
jgi:putative Mg2+ transporter-C (MgtC) family protein